MVQVSGFDRYRTCPVPRRRPFDQRPACRSSADDVRRHERAVAADPKRQDSRARHDQCHAHRGAAKPPNYDESGFPGFVSTSWTGLLAPARTPGEVIDRLNTQMNEGLRSAELQSALAKLSNQPLGGTPHDFTQ